MTKYNKQTKMFLQRSMCNYLSFLECFGVLADMMMSTREKNSTLIRQQSCFFPVTNRVPMGHFVRTELQLALFFAVEIGSKQILLSCCHLFGLLKTAYFSLESFKLSLQPCMQNINNFLKP